MTNGRTYRRTKTECGLSSDCAVAVGIETSACRIAATIAARLR